jgi:hypothetical protein
MCQRAREVFMISNRKDTKNVHGQLFVTGTTVLGADTEMINRANDGESVHSSRWSYPASIMVPAGTVAIVKVQETRSGFYYTEEVHTDKGVFYRSSVLEIFEDRRPI